AMGDGRVSSDALLGHARAAAKRFVRFDMAAAAEQSGSVISAVLFGALAGTGVLPFSRAQFEATIARGGGGVAPSLHAFEAAFARVAGSGADEDAIFAVADEPGSATAAHGATVAAPAASALDGTTDAPAAGGIPRSAQDDGAPRPATIHPEVRALLDRSAAFAPE